MADWRMLKVDYVLVGRLSAQPDGRFELRYELVSVANGERLLGTAVPVDPKALKRASHRVSDAVYERILGVRGAFATRIAYVAVEGPGEPAQLPAHRVGRRRRQRTHRVRLARPDHVAHVVARRALARLRVVPQRALGRLRADAQPPGRRCRCRPSPASTARPRFRRTARSLRSRFRGGTATWTSTC